MLICCCCCCCCCLSSRLEAEQRSANQSIRLENENENETGIDTTDRWQWIEDQVSNNSIQADIGIICNSRNIFEEIKLC